MRSGASGDAALAPLALAAAPRRVFDVIQARPDMVAAWLGLANVSRVRGYRHQVRVDAPVNDVNVSGDLAAASSVAVDQFLAG